MLAARLAKQRREVNINIRFALIRHSSNSDYTKPHGKQAW